MANDWRLFIYGGVASIVAEFGTFPIDTAKTRLQIQGQQIDCKYSELKYRGMIDCFLKIYRDEGFKALYSGISPAVLRQATYGTLKFGTYYTLKNKAAEKGLLHDPITGKEYVWGNVLCAIIAGAISSAIATPTDVLKVRMQVHGKGSSSLGLIGCFREIYKYEGIRGLWRGVGPTAQRALVIAAVELPVYDFCKIKLMNAFGDQVANHLISSFIASLGSAIASTPIDVIRTRLMNQKRISVPTFVSNVQKTYTSSFDCAIRTVRSEGFLALYKGFIPAWIRMGPWNVIFFITYEQLKKL